MVDEAIQLVKKHINNGVSPWDVEALLLSLGFPSAVIGVAFERVAAEFRDSARKLKLEADELEAMHATA